MSLADLAGKAVILTGAAGGIGQELAYAFAQAGANLLLVDVVSELRELLHTCWNLDATATAMEVDVSYPDEACRVVERCLNAYGQVDVLVHAAGTTRDSPIWVMNHTDWELVLRVHLFSAFNMVKPVAGIMQKQGTGNIVLFASGAAGGSTGQANYAAAKAGVVGLGLSTAHDLCRYGISCNIVMPGAATPATVLPPSEKLSPKHISPLVLHLASRASWPTTGKVFAIVGNRMSLIQSFQPTKEIFFPDISSQEDFHEYFFMLL